MIPFHVSILYAERRIRGCYIGAGWLAVAHGADSAFGNVFQYLCGIGNTLTPVEFRVANLDRRARPQRGSFPEVRFSSLFSFGLGVAFADTLDLCRTQRDDRHHAQPIEFAHRHLVDCACRMQTFRGCMDDGENHRWF